MTLRLTHIATLAALTATAPITATAQVAAGLYEAPYCQNPQSSSIVRVSPGEISFFESYCTISNARVASGVANATTYDAYCSGEGEEPFHWTTYTIQAIQNGLILYHASGPGYSYAYCGQ